ncbi:DUF6953 family protein [Rhizobium ruizarguesonis]|uniref:DUF6953 family protein n=1 Tax=Rhizobium ruizarguesonis TaxID=2081791 RepID=UPI0010310A9E|nr:hypothetical protein ELH65_10225 [Rhizobium ruizarguesonis]
MSLSAAVDWMVQTLDAEGTLYQDVAVSYISEHFGEELAGINANGNLSISPLVLKAFNARTPNAVWSRGGRFWRTRENFDLPGRQQP